MLFRWLRLRKIRRTPFPPAWRVFLDRTLDFWSKLTADEQERLEEEIRLFIAERNWEGCGGLDLTDEMQLIVAAEACRLLLGRPGERFRFTSTILVYPNGYFSGPSPTPVLGGGTVRVIDPVGTPVLGQAYERGPVILSWQHALDGATRHEDGHNVILHEFAHKLDMANGSTDGMPPMDSAAQAREWHLVMTEAYEKLGRCLRTGLPTPLRPYALTNPAEFFAVSTEIFFERPERLDDWDADLYRVLATWYRQDPKSRA